MLVRPAEMSDVGEIGRVHIRAWQAVYLDEIPAGYLDGLQAEDRANYWRGYLTNTGRSDGGLLVVECGGVVQGFGCFGTAVDGRGEVFAMNIDPDFWRLGLGDALLNEMECAMSTLGLGKAVLWTTVGNERAQEFYKKNGWRRESETRKATVHGVEVHEVQFCKELNQPV